MSENDEIPDTATPQVPDSTYTEAGDLGGEPSPMEVPDGVEIPPENQLEGVGETPNTKEKAEAIGEETLVYKSIWPPLILAFIIGLSLGGLVIFSPLVPKGPRDISQINPDTRGNNSPRSTPENFESFTQVIWDESTQAHNNSSARELAADRVKTAEKNIFWIADFPNDPNILASLVQKKKTESFPIIIIAGKQASPDHLRLAKSHGLTVLQSNRIFEEPTSVLLIDNKYTVDASRPSVAWESIDKNVTTSTLNWIENLVKTSTPQ